MRDGIVLAVITASALLGSACRDRQLTQLKSVRDEVCACKTIACAQAALDRIPKQDPRANHATQAVANEMLDCLSKVYDSDRPNPDLDEPHPEGSGSAAP